MKPNSEPTPALPQTGLGAAVSRATLAFGFQVTQTTPAPTTTSSRELPPLRLVVDGGKSAH